MKEYSLNQLDPMDFMKMPVMRETAIRAAGTEIPDAERTINEIAAALHPKALSLEVCRIEDESDTMRSYWLKNADGEQPLPYFESGAYLPIEVVVNGVRYRRPYSISSSPKDAGKGYCRISVKQVRGGIVSNAIIDSFRVGTTIKAAAPLGQVTCSRIRDAGHVVDLAGGSGITPFVSMAHSVMEKIDDYTLTILYGARTKEDLAFYTELKEIAEKCDKVRVIPVLSEKAEEGFESGFITKELIEKYCNPSISSFYICGPGAMHTAMDRVLEPFGLERKWIRHEVHGEPVRDDDKAKDVTLTLCLHGKKQSIAGSTCEP
ncbi:MAG: FAD-binding oxidoreductase, partial [Clostridia bacterium]|nr:FAD-binding oxidoreductase [Clostridia bacterium]